MAENPNEIFADLSLISLLLARRQSVKVLNQIVAEIEDIQRRLAAIILAVDPASPGSFRERTRRYRQAVEEADELIAEAYKRIREIAEEWLEQLSEEQAEREKDNLFAAFALAVGLASIDTGKLIVSGATVGQWFARQEAEMKFKAATTFRQAVQNREPADVTAKRIRGELPELPVGFGKGAETAAKITVRSAESAVLEEVARATVEDSDGAAEIRYGWQHISVLDQRTSETCRSRAFKIWDNEYKPIGHKLPFARPPLHPNCVLEDSLVTPSGLIMGVSKRRFDGNIIRIKTACGNELTCTPNHPILTDGGWVAAQFLKQGSRVVRYAAGENPSVEKWKHDHGVTTAKDIFESFLLRKNVALSEMPSSTPDFHGDGTDGEVAVIGADLGLLRQENATAFHHFKEAGFKFGGQKSLGLLESGPLLKLFCGSLSSANGDVSSLCQSRPFSGRSSSHSSELLLASVAGLNSAFQETGTNGLRGAPLLYGYCTKADARPEIRKSGFPINGRSGRPGFSQRNSRPMQSGVDRLATTDTKLASNILCGETGLIQFDDVIGIEFVRFHGDVFNFETTDNFYVCNGIVTHNCRSRIVMTLLDEKSMPEQTLGQWLRRQSESNLRRMFGAAKLKLWRDGKITDAELLRY